MPMQNVSIRRAATLHRIATAALAISTLCFAWVGSRLDQLGGMQMALPLPSIGQSVTGAIFLTGEEAYVLQAAVPSRAAPDSRPGHERVLPLRLAVEVMGNDKPALTMSGPLTYRGSIGNDQQLYVSSPVMLPPGQHTVRITTLSRGSELPSAVLSIESVHEQASLLTIMGLTRVLGWAMFAAGVALAIVGSILSFGSRDEA